MLVVQSRVNQLIFIVSTTNGITMDTELLKTFLEVRDCRHFGKAAENLYLTQAAVSSRIRQLEQYFGVTLFNRNRNNIQLTQAGEKLVAHAQAMLNAQQMARQEVSVASEQLMQISIAGTPNTWDVFIHDAISKIYASHPQINLVAEILSREQLTRLLLERTLDVAILFDPPKASELKIEKLHTIKLMPVTTFTDNIDELSLNLRYILIDWGTSFNIWHSKQYKNMPPPAMRTSTGRIALDLMLQCGGSAYLPDVFVEPYLESGELKIIEELPSFDRDIFIAFHKNNENEAKIFDIKQLFNREKPDLPELLTPR